MRDEWLEGLQAQVGKKLIEVKRRDEGEDSYYRLTFEDGAYFEWHGSLKVTT